MARATARVGQGSGRDLLVLGLLAVVLVLGWHTPLLVPLRILVVLFHELGHAVAAWITGGSVVSISLSADEGGVATTAGGWRFLILNGGYLGSLLAGLAILVASRRPGPSRGLLASLGLLVLLAALFVVRPILSFGFGYTLLAGAGLMVAGVKAPVRAAWWVLRGIGVFSVLYALVDIRDDILLGRGVPPVPGMVSDADALAALTGIPAVVWGVGWVLVGCLALWVLRRRIA